jgi:hypothetical protein
MTAEGIIRRAGTRWVRLAQACVAGIALGTLVIGSLPPLSYNKDLQQEYLTAWALRDGIDIFTPLNQLSARYFPTPTDYFPHASPHPPLLALLSVPLTLLPFPAVVLLWLAMNIALLIVVGRWLGLSVQGSLPLAAWPPLWWVLYLGQFELVILALAMLGWRAAAGGRDWRAGAWLGVATSIKLYPAFFLLPFAARKRWRVILAAALVVNLVQLGNLATVGASGFVRYYIEVLPAVSARYQSIGLNCSPYGALLRLFGDSADVLPVTYAPGVIVPIAVALSMLALLGSVRLDPEAAPVAMLVALPRVWFYHAVLALPEIVSLVRSPNFRRAALLAGLAAGFVLPLVNDLLRPILAAMAWTGGKAPSFAGLLAAIQPAGFVGLLILSVAVGLTGKRPSRT